MRALGTAGGPRDTVILADSLSASGFEYVEDAGAAHEMTYDCATIPGTISQSCDCGGDDYFNPAPPAARSVPVINGAARRGSPPQSGMGTWLNKPRSYTFIWQRLSRGRWSTVLGDRARQR